MFTFLSDALLRWLDVVQEDKQLVVTDDVAVLSKPPLADLSFHAHMRKLIPACHYMWLRQSTREAMCGVRCWYLHQSYLHPVNLMTL